MRLIVRHETRYHYESPVAHAVQRLALTPVSFPGQTILNWSIGAPGIESAPRYKDAYGNLVHLCTQARLVDELTIIAEGQADIEDTSGIVGRLPDEPPPRLFLRRTPLTTPSPAMVELARQLSAQEANRLACIHLIMASLHEKLRFDTAQTSVTTTAVEAFGAGHGVCQDFSHILIAMARTLDLPARYITGYLRLTDEASSTAQHAWVEVFLDELGWVAFDAANGICPTDNYLRLCCGLDALGAAPIKGLHSGISKESLSVDVTVRMAQQ